MSVYVDDITMDQALNYFKNNITEMYVCSGDPGTRASAITNKLAGKTALSAGSFTGPAAGDTNGRKITKNAESAIPISATGTAAVVCFTTASTLLWKVNLSATQALTSGGTVDVAAVDHEIADAT